MQESITEKNVSGVHEISSTVDTNADNTSKANNAALECVKNSKNWHH
jgi:methyl-accepting chemotaxis protein